MKLGALRHVIITSVGLTVISLSNLSAEVPIPDEVSGTTKNEVNASKSNSELTSKIVAKYAGKQISLEQLDEEIKKRPSQARMLQMQGGGDDVRQQVRLSVLTQMIDRQLLLDAATANKITIPKQEFDKLYEASISRFGGKDKLDVFLKGVGLTQDSFERELRSDMLINKYIQDVLTKDIKIDEQSTRANYESNKNTYSLGEAVHVRHILLKIDKDSSESEVQSSQKKIEDLYNQAIQPNADFAALAKSNSQCPSAENGGDLDFIEKGRTVEPFENAAFALKPGEISKPVRTEFGFHIIKQEDRREPRQLGFEEVRSFIEQRIKQEKSGEIVKAKLEELRKSASVEILL